MVCLLNTLFSGSVKNYLEEFLSDRIGLKVVIDRVNLHCSGLTFKGLKIQQPAGFQEEGNLVEVNTVRITGSLIDLLFRRQFALPAVTIDGTVVNVIKRTLLLGKINIREIPPLRPLNRDITIARLIVQNTHISVKGPWMTIRYPMPQVQLRDISRIELEKKYGDLWGRVRKLTTFLPQP